jgi:hypothetical protein
MVTAPNPWRQPLSARLVRVLVLLLAAGLCVVAMRWASGAPPVVGTPAVETAPDSRMESAGGTRVAPVVAGAPLPHRPEGPPPTLPEEPERLPPLDIELEDSVLGAMRSAFERAPLATQVLYEQRAWAESALEAQGVRFLYFDLECTAQMCRAELGVEDVLDIRDLGGVPLPDGLSVVQSPVVTREDRPGLGLVLYWGVDGQDLHDLVPSHGEGE